MEESINTPVLIQTDGDNQILVFLVNSFYSSLRVIVNVFILAANIFFTPFVWTYYFWAYAIDKSWQITTQIFSAFYELLTIIPLSVEIWFWSVSCWVSFLLFIKSTDEIHVTIEEKIYKRLKRILYILHGLPFSPKHAAALNAILKKLPIFGKSLLPYPDFLFEDTFTNINYRNGAVSMTLPVPAVPSLPSETESKPVELATSDPSPPSNLSTDSFQSAIGQSSTSSTTTIVNEPKPETDQAESLRDQSSSGSERSLSSI